MALQIRRMRRNDLEQLTRWGKHNDPRFYHYSFPYREPADLDLWFRKKQRPVSRFIYAIDVDGRVVGFVTLKNIQWFKLMGEMGITLDPNYLDRGIGTKAIVLYLNHVFRFIGLQRIWLRTAIFNKRAIRTYEKVGFEVYEHREEAYEEQAFINEIYGRFDHFRLAKKQLMTDYVYMEMTKQAFDSQYGKVK